MKLSKLYTNQPNLFTPILFNDGLNVIYGEIRLPENKHKDTHNLGKSVLGRVIDFALLAKRHPQSFLFKHEERFQSFVFFIEIKLGDQSYLTVRRSVTQPSKVSFKKHTVRAQDLSSMADEKWDHVNVSFDKAKDLLDSFLSLTSLKSWSYRQSLGYLIRSQDDYYDVFQLKKFQQDAQWKPYLSHILGFDASLLNKQYARETELSDKKSTEKTLKKELGNSVDDVGKVEGILFLKHQEVEKKQQTLDAFDFRNNDREKTKLVVDEIDKKISNLNKKRYSLECNLKKIINSLEEDKIIFNPNKAEKIFKDVGIFFSGQIKKDFEQLIEFNKDITEERIAYLSEEKKEVTSEIEKVNAELSELGKSRSESLSFLSETNIFNKYKLLSNEIIKLKADIEYLEKKQEYLNKFQELRKEISNISEEHKKISLDIHKNVQEQGNDKSSLFSNVRSYFNDLVNSVMSRKALLSVSLNKKEHLDFKAEILDESGNSTSADAGHTYKKLLCVAFDLAVLKSHQHVDFPHFAFHDGVFESLDNRKKENLLSELRKCANSGIQSIITVIDSDVPSFSLDKENWFDSSEIVLKLHDEGTQGRLFKMQSW